MLGSWAQLFNNLVNYYMGTVCKIPMRSSQSFRGSQHPTLLCTFFRIGQLKEQGTPLFFQNGGSGVFSAEDSYHHFIKRHCNAMHCVLSPAICIDGFAFWIYFSEYYQPLGSSRDNIVLPTSSRQPGRSNLTSSNHNLQTWLLLS